MRSDHHLTPFDPSFLDLFEEAEAEALRRAGTILVHAVEDAALARALAWASEPGGDDIHLPLPKVRRRLACVAQALKSLRQVLDGLLQGLELPPEEERELRLETGDYTPGLELYVSLEPLVTDRLVPLIAALEELGRRPAARG